MLTFTCDISQHRANLNPNIQDLVADMEQDPRVRVTTTWPRQQGLCSEACVQGLGLRVMWMDGRLLRSHLTQRGAAPVSLRKRKPSHTTVPTKPQPQNLGQNVPNRQGLGANLSKGFSSDLEDSQM